MESNPIFLGGVVMSRLDGKVLIEELPNGSSRYWDRQLDAYFFPEYFVRIARLGLADLEQRLWEVRGKRKRRPIIQRIIEAQALIGIADMETQDLVRRVH